MRLGSLAASLGFLFSAVQSLAALSEPGYCDPAKFSKLEHASPVKGLDRAHVYQIGSLTLAGLAVGGSPIAGTEALAQKFSTYHPTEKFCTWYLNTGNAKAGATFNHRALPMPALAGPEIADDFERIMSSSFEADPTSFVSCAVNHHYVAMGCDGMQHRGPSVFAMFLSYSGCTPEHSVAIVNQVWGNNWVYTSTREAIAQKAFEQGAREPQSRAALRAVMSTPLFAD